VCVCLPSRERKNIVCKHVFFFLLMYMSSHVYSTLCVCVRVCVSVHAFKREVDVCVITLPDGHRVR